MQIQGFVGPAYVMNAPNFAAESLYNWLPQSLEVPSESAQTVYEPRPGLSVYDVLGSGLPVRAMFEQDGRCFAVGGQHLFELFENASPTDWGALTNSDAHPATINSNGVAGHQLYITSGGQGDIFDLDTNTITPITAAGYPVGTPMGTYLDTYFLTSRNDTAQFNISGILDGLAWAALDFAVRVQASDNIVGIIQFNKLIWLVGSQTSEPWYDSGATFPFQSVPQVLIPVGCCAPFSICRTSGALCWLHQSERGRGIFIAMTPDYNPKRISTYPLETIWQTYPTLSDAVCSTMTWMGHELILLHFPSGNATWAYDLGENQWSRWSWWNTQTGTQDRFRGWVHCQAFGTHLMGDWETGVVYELDADLATDADAPIVWERASPHLNSEKRFNFYSNFLLDMETGLGGSTPITRLDWSDDGGNTWSTPIDMSTGAIGESTTRCRAAGNLGRSRDRVFRVRTSNNKPPRVLNAYVDVTGGTN